MKKTLLLSCALAFFLMANADNKLWDFTSWSDATVNNLKADAATSIFTGWSDVEKDPTKDGASQEPTAASKDNCFWLQGTVNDDGSVSANGTVIAELAGLKFDASYAATRSLAIAVNYPSTTLGDYAGGAYLWLGGKGKTCFTIPGIKAHSTITIVAESHKPAEGRGIGLYVGDTQLGENFTPTVQASQSWVVDADCDVVVKNTNGCHIYSIAVSEGEQEAGQPILTFQGKVGEEVSLSFGVHGSEDTYTVDFGDGNVQTEKVGIDNKGPVREDGTTGSATKFTGIVAGDGTIKVYGTNDVWYFIGSGGVMPTSFDQEKLMNVVQMSITGADVESVVLPAYPKMTQFSMNNSSVKSVDVSQVPTLTSLTINNTTASKFAPQLESIDVSKNTELTYLSIQANQNNYGKLKTLDLTKNTKLDGMGLYVLYNQLTELKLGENTLTAINVQNNKLTSLEWEKLSGLKNLYAADNELTSINVSGMANLVWLDVKNNQLTGDLDLTANQKFQNVYVNNNKLTSVKVSNVTKQFYVDGNQMTLATLPAQPAGMNTASKTKQFHYAPQAAFQVAETVGLLDLSSQLTVAKGELNPDDYTQWLEGTTNYSFVTASGTALVEGTDYEVVEPGKFKFVIPQTEKVYGVMTTAAFPKFTGASAYQTTAFTIDIASAINNVKAADATAKVYNLQGVEVAQPLKGIYIQNGKKVVVN